MKGVKRDADDPATPAIQRLAAELRGIKQKAGHSFTHLQSRTSYSRSTLERYINGKLLPTREAVTAIARACDVDPQRLMELRDEAERESAPRTTPAPVRRRLPLFGKPAAAESVSLDARGQDVETEYTLRQSILRRWRYLLGVVAAGAVGVAATLGAQSVVAMTQSQESTDDGNPIPGLAVPAIGSWVRIHPARTPELCVTEGHDRTYRYPTAVATQRLCAEAVFPRIYLEPIGAATAQIHWHHPKYGIGCLTLLMEGPGRNLLEPQDACSDRNPAQQFRIEPIGPPAAAHFRIRPVATGQCLALRDQDTVDGAEIVQGRCSGAADQEFTISLIPPE
ncbi:ricin-type beta-trefoil lectin protein [Nocardia tenerifensis]|uniref:Ricin-type beta-trefoil lectin protein n=1 Tax=Nocardia tenerifensis TaxID=228006 RepID=A0A318KZW8_9NOCA|nr:helix-turn-helix domain-containing protein [Nocardia tenerifensis]PXX71414.1 ricin-type beta-trefoil lectin protein [Nocardia tenerifensis]